MIGILDTPILNIKAASKGTGLKPHTIRAWERRYGLPVPERRPGGHRVYSPQDIATLKWLKDRRDEGLSISRAVNVWRSLESKGQDPFSIPQYAKTAQDPISTHSTTIASLRDDWIEACVNFNERAAEQVMNQAFAIHPVEVACLELVIKGLATMGKEWYRGQIMAQQEHFASELAIRRLESLITGTPHPTMPEPILVICPPEEQHTVSALTITLFLRRRGRNALFLGANVPIERLRQVIENTKPKLVIVVAQQLFTAATSLQIAQLMIEYKIPIAFVGRIFNLISGIRDRIPGIYLGKTLGRVPSTVNQLLANSLPTPSIEPPSQEYLLALEEFRNRQHWIETRVSQELTSDLLDQGSLKIANTHLSRNIVAALTLGDISFLMGDIEWVEGLLAYQGIPTQIFRNYIRHYAKAVADELDERGSLIETHLLQFVQGER
jgi:DNA-binding transcriptional MerR regulator